MTPRISYLINQYPKISHTFIRREIRALENQGFEIQRLSLRGWESELVDEEDVCERKLTRYVTRDSMVKVLFNVIKTLFVSPRLFLSAFWLAARMRHNSNRPYYYHFFYFVEACHILSYVKSFDAVHMHAHFGSNTADILMLVHALGGPPYSFTVHGLEELDFNDMSEKVDRAAFVVAISSFGRSQLYCRIRYASWSKVKVIHCGIDNLFYDIAPTPPASERRIASVGRFSKEKGQLLLIEAAHQLALKSVDFELVLVGDGEMRPELEGLIARYGLSKQVRITGWLSNDQVREQILLARGLVLPSFSEGLPVVIMEAMALRRPILATYISGIPELVIPRENGWLFPAGSIDELASAMEDCLSKSPDELRKMGEAGYLRALERHSIEKESAKLASLFRKVNL